MYNYTVIVYGILIPDDYRELFEEYLQTDILINPYNGNEDPEPALGLEISDTDIGSTFIESILSFDKEKTDKIYQEEIKKLIESINLEKELLQEELDYSDEELNSLIYFLTNTKPSLVRVEATS